MPELFVRFGSGGDSLPGNASEASHLGWFEAESLSFPTTTMERRQSALGASSQSRARMRLGLPVNASTSKLYAAAFRNRSFSEAEIELCNSAQHRPILRYKLKNAILGGCQPQPDRFLLDVSFDSMQVQYLNAEGRSVPTAGFDIKTNSKV